MLRTEFYDLADFFRGFGCYHRIGRNTRVKGFVLTEPLPHRRCLGKSLAKLRLKAGDHLGHRRRRNLDWSLISHG